MQSIYESGEYVKQKPDWHAGDAPTKARWVAEILERNQLRPAEIVDIGCGSGEILIQLAKRYPEAQLHGYDISPQAYQIAAPKATSHLSFHLGDYRDMTHRPDLLMAIDVIEHVDDYIGFIRAMKDRATFKLFHIPLDMSVQMVLRSRPILEMRSTIGHIHSFYKDTALATLAYCGLEVVDWNYTSCSVELPKTRRATLLNLPRKLVTAFNPDLAVRLLGGSELMVLTR